MHGQTQEALATPGRDAGLDARGHGEDVAQIGRVIQIRYQQRREADQCRADTGIPTSTRASQPVAADIAAEMIISA